MIKQWSPFYNLLIPLLDSKYFNANLQSRASCPTRHSLCKKKNIIYILKMKGGNLCSPKCFMLYFFFNSNSEALQSSELWSIFSLSETIKRSLNYLLMVILPAMCRLQNPITTLMKSISSQPQPLYTQTAVLTRWLYGCGKKVTKGQSHNPGAEIPPKHFTGTTAGWGLQRMEWLIKETFKMSF